MKMTVKRHDFLGLLLKLVRDFRTQVTFIIHSEETFSQIITKKSKFSLFLKFSKSEKKIQNVQKIQNYQKIQRIVLNQHYRACFLFV